VITVCGTSLTVVVAFWRLESKHFGLDKAGTLTTYFPTDFIKAFFTLKVSYLFTLDVSNYFLTLFPCPDFHQTRNFSTAFFPHFVPNFIQIDQEIRDVRVEISKVRVELHVLYFKCSVPLSWFTQNTGLLQHFFLKSCCVEVHGYPTNGLVC
jgi:hypothetical protein